MASEKVDLFFNVKPAKAITTILESREELTASELSTKIDTTYAHTVKIVSEFEEENLVTKKKVGRRKPIQLTSEGMEKAKMIQSCIDELEDKDADKDLTEASPLSWNG